VPIAGTAADIFYDRLFEIAPDVRSLFPHDLAEQKKKLIAMLATAVTNLHQVDKIMGAVEDLGKKAPRFLRSHREAIRASRSRALVHAGEGARRRLHSSGEIGVDGSVYDARGCDAKSSRIDAAAQAIKRLPNRLFGNGKA
jgi:hypothetical protein